MQARRRSGNHGCTRTSTAIEPPHSEKYHLTEDMVDKGLAWIKRHQAFSPDKPFLMYWAPGAAHGPHHVFPEWADKYKGKFDDGWDKYRERVVRPSEAARLDSRGHEADPRSDTMASWDSIPEAERPFQRRLMEVFAGFAEHTDAQVGKLVDGLEQLGVRDNTIILYIWGDNGSSAEGQKGSVSELLAQNNIANTIEQQMKAMNALGGLPALGGPKMDNMYHAGWAWAGSAPFRIHQARRRALRRHAQPDGRLVAKGDQARQDAPFPVPPRQRHRADALRGDRHQATPDEVNGFKQDPMDGVSMVYTFANAQAPGRKKTQYFENNASRGIYHDGWFACAFGPFVPWDTPSTAARLKGWDANNDVWELYDLTKDFSQAENLADKEPDRLAKMKDLFLAEAKANKALPIGGGLWTRFHPEDVISSPYHSWRFDATTTRMPEFTAPGLGKRSNHVAIDVEVGPEASGVMYALGGASGGVALYMDKGQLVYEYNMLIIERTVARSEAKIPPGRHKIEVDETIARPGAPADVVLKLDGQEVAHTTVQRTVPGAFTASETFDVGVDLGSPVSLTYFDRAPFKFDGKIDKVVVELK